MPIKNKTNTDLVIITLLGYLNWSMRKGSIDYISYFGIPSRKRLLYKMTFNPLLTNSVSIFDAFLAIRICCDDDNITTRLLSTATLKLSTAMQDKKLTNDIKSDSEDILEIISNGFISKEDVYKHSYLICSSLRGLSQNLLDKHSTGKLKQSIYALYLPHAHSKIVNGSVLAKSIFDDLTTQSANIDSYEKLNKLFIPCIDLIYEELNNGTK